MKMGVREFRERVSEVVNGSQPVTVTNNGRAVGTYIPLDFRDGKPAETGIDMVAWVAHREKFAREWRAATPDWRERLRSIGIDPDEDPLD